MSDFRRHDAMAAAALAGLRSALDDGDIDGALRHHLAYGWHLHAMGSALKNRRNQQNQPRGENV